MTTFTRLARLTPLAAALAALPAFATNGYFPHGYGLKASGMGGAATALAQDSMGGATNPASMVFAGSRLDIGATVFSPRRAAALGVAARRFRRSTATSRATATTSWCRSSATTACSTPTCRPA
jgi:hypothetical protein